MKRIIWTTKALRQIRKIHDRETRELIFKAVGALNEVPKCLEIKKLRGREEYRLRIKHWRVIFSESKDYITVEEVKKRDEHTY